MSKINAALALLVVISPAFAQPSSTMQARIVNGNSNRGKCSIEVTLNGTTEIEIQYTEGRIRKITGAPAVWRRLECTAPLPANPSNLRFTSQKGHGRQYLLKTPQQNRGVAVVRIEETSGRDELYRFDLEWRPGSNDISGVTSDPPAGNLGGGGLRGWNEQLDFRGRGDGYYRTFRGSDDMLTEAAVTIDRSGRVQVDLTTNRRERLILNGNLVLAEKDRLVANMAGGPIQGTMEIRLNGRNRVEELAMTGAGRNRFELRWQPR